LIAGEVLAREKKRGFECCILKRKRRKSAKKELGALEEKKPITREREGRGWR